MMQCSNINHLTNVQTLLSASIYACSQHFSVEHAWYNTRHEAISRAGLQQQKQADKSCAIRPVQWQAAVKSLYTSPIGQPRQTAK